MREITRHRRVYKLLVPPITLFTKIKFRYEFDSLADVESPYLLLSNHNLELDPLLIGAAAKNHLYFVASEHIQRKGLATWALNYFIKPIVHKKGKQGANTVKQMLKYLKEGLNICIFPEGNRSFNGLTGDMLPSIGRVAKKSGAKLITYRVEGGYLTQPRWSVKLRRGKIRGRLVHIYTNEELQNMTDDQIHEAICNDLYEDAYATQETEHIAFKGKNLALGLESTVFVCPACSGIGKLHSKENRFFCDCGFSSVYDEYGYLTDQNKQIYTVKELDLNQKKRLEEYVEKSGDELLFKDPVIRYEVGTDHLFGSITHGELKAYKDHLECCGQVLYWSDITGMAIYSRSCLIIHSNAFEGHIELKSDDIGFNALKYYYLYQLTGK